MSNNDDNQMTELLLSAAWGLLLILVFAIVIGTDSNAPNPDSNEIFSYIVHTNRGSFFSGIAGPIYTISNTLTGENGGIILDDTWGQGNGYYKFGFVIGSILLATSLNAIAALMALIRMMLPN